jgi:ASC-1-like (ASCH) protein
VIRTRDDTPRASPTRHVALVRPPFIAEILAGRKTIETRLAATRRPPFNRAQPGERIFFKQTAGPWRAAARIAHAEHIELRSHRHLMQLFNERRHDIAGHALEEARAFFRQRTGARFASFLTLADVTPITAGPTIPRLHGNAWLCLPHAATSTRRKRSA